MDKIYKFNAQIMKAEKVDGAYVKFPYSVKEAFGSNGIIKVAATFDGYNYRGILAKMGNECHIIGITKAIREKIGKNPGDEIEVTIKKDEESRAEEVPEVLKGAFVKSVSAEEFFNTLTDSQKNKFIKFITSAKKQETMDTRVEKVIKMLSNGEKMK